MRKIIHIDMDAFYAAVEQLDNPELRGKPVIVGGQPDSRGVVCTASYEARPFGVRSAMACSKAYRLCPHGIFVPPRFDRYKAVSQQLHTIFRRVTLSIEPLSLDEAYLDVTENFLNEPMATTVARYIQERVRSELQLTCSAGVANNKLVAKIASDYHKPAGLTVVPPQNAVEFLGPLPARAIPGIGPKTGEKLQQHNIRTIADIRTASTEQLEHCFGRFAERYRERAHGIDQRPVQSHGERKQISIEDTFNEDLHSHDACADALKRLSHTLSDRVEKHQKQGTTLTLKVKYADFTQITRSTTRVAPFTSSHDIHTHAVALLEKTNVAQQAVRLLGIGISRFKQATDDGQTSLDFENLPTQQTTPGFNHDSRVGLDESP